MPNRVAIIAGTIAEFAAIALFICAVLVWADALRVGAVS